MCVVVIVINNGPEKDKFLYLFCDYLPLIFACMMKRWGLLHLTTVSIDYHIDISI